MMRNLIATATLLLVGCSPTQDELGRDGRRFQTSSVRTPLGVASCVASNIKESGVLTTSIREVGQFGAFEVSATNPKLSSVIITARAEPILKGSFVTLWISPTQPSPEDAFANAVKGC
jgi:hypothetical protein